MALNRSTEFKGVTVQLYVLRKLRMSLHGL